MTAAPISPPTSAWDELEGRPNHKVKRFHTIAAMSAAITTEIWISSLFNKSLPMVVATATPKRNGPMNSAMAAIVSACRPDSARSDHGGDDTGAIANAAQESENQRQTDEQKKRQG